MTSPLQPAAVDTELLDLAELVLSQSGYTVERLSVDGVAYLLGEDQDNVVVVAAVLTIDEVLAAEPALTRALGARLSRGAADAKKWDGYVVLVTGARPDDSAVEALTAITYNLNQVRRLIRVGVEATSAAVTRSLRAVLPLSDVAGEASVLDPLTALGKRLVADGLAQEEIDAALSAFRASAVVDGSGPEQGDLDNLADPSEGHDISVTGPEDD